MPAAMINKMTFKLVPDLILVKSYTKNLMLRSGVSTFVVKSQSGKPVLNEPIGYSESKNHESYKLRTMNFKRVPGESDDGENDYIEFVFSFSVSSYYIQKAKNTKFLNLKFTDTHSKYEYYVSLNNFRISEDRRLIFALLNSETYGGFKQLLPVCLMFEDNSPSTPIDLEVVFSNKPNNQKNGPMKEHVPTTKSGVREVKRLPHFLSPGVIYKRQTKSDIHPRYFIKDGDGYKEIKVPDDLSAI